MLRQETSIGGPLADTTVGWSEGRHVQTQIQILPAISWWSEGRHNQTQPTFLGETTYANDVFLPKIRFTLYFGCR